MKWIAPTQKDTDNGALERRLWAAADQLRANSGLTAQQYSSPLLGLIFLRFAEVRFGRRRAELSKAAASSRRGSRVDDPTAYHAEAVLYLPEKSRFEGLLKLPEGADVGKAVNAAMTEIEKHNEHLKGVLPKTYQLFTSTLLKDLLKKVSEIPSTVELQAIARANRVYAGKHSGLIVDYANVFLSLEKALAIYGKGTGGERPVFDKRVLVGQLRDALTGATAFCTRRGIALDAIEGLATGDMKRLERLDDAVNALIAPDAVRKELFAHERLVVTLFNAVKPDPVVAEFAPRIRAVVAIADAVRVKMNPDPSDISGVMNRIAALLDDSITGVVAPSEPVRRIDISKIDFDKLRKRYAESNHKNTELEQLKAAIRAQLDRLIRLNSQRADYLEKFEQLIERYNNGSRSIEQILEDLLQFAGNLSEEEERHVREHLTEAELTVFDILTRPGPDLTAAEREEVKKVARQVLARLKSLLALDWRRQTQARAQVRLAIEDTLDSGLPRVYAPDMYRAKCSAVFEHVFETYVGQLGRSHLQTAE